MVSSEELADYLKRHHLGAGNATTNGALSQQFGFTDRGASGRHGIRNSARLTTLINAARVAHHPICSDRRGIFYAEFRDEVRATIDFNRKSAAKLLRVADLCERAAAGLPPQP
jgi:hypothetical protein